MRTTAAFWLILLTAASLCRAQDGDWSLVWSDEFNGHFLDTSSWNYDVGTGSNGWGNNELQYYTPGNNIIFNDSCLVIELRNQIMGTAQYTSSRINTRKKVEFQYGKIQARIQAPYSQAVWPSFWTLGANYNAVGWPACGEIDIFEMACGDFYPDNRGDNTNFAVVHSDDDGGFPVELKGYVTIQRRMADDFHIFTLVWDQDSVRFFFDSSSTPYYKADISKAYLDAFRQPQSLVLDMALGGTGFAGSPDGSTVLPQLLAVDWIRWYQRKTAVNRPLPDRKGQSQDVPRMVAGGILITVADPGRSFLEIYSCDGRLVQDMSQHVRGLSAGSHVVPLPRLRALPGMCAVRFDNGKDMFTGMMNLGR